MSTRKENYFQTQLFKPSKIRNVDGTARSKPMSLSETAQDTFGVVSPTGSFRFDTPGTAMKNTQQLNVDWSKFENHTFFNSARNKVHTALEKIINQYPFDGTRAEHEKFINKINGFEKYVLDEFPKHNGFLIFSRSADIEGTHLAVSDHHGVGNPGSLINSTGLPKLNFDNGPFTVEFSILIPSGTTNGNEVIAQRLVDKNKGFTICLSSSFEESSPEGEANLIFALSNTDDVIKTNVILEKGKFNQICAVYERGSSNKLKLYVDGDHKSESNPSKIGGFDFFNTSFLIGTGSTHNIDTLDYVPEQTFSGALDEFRFFKEARSSSDIQKYRQRELFAQDTLDLYFKFNEPSGSFNKSGLGNSSLALDSSGNGLHTTIQNFTMGLRNTSRVGNVKFPMLLEDISNSPVLFPSFEGIENLAITLMRKAAQYDANNPNLITNLVPQHYLDDTAFYEGKSDSEGDIGETPGITMDRPGGNEIKQSQLISSVLFMWAESFDEIKMFIDEFGRLLSVDYVDEKTISDHMIPYLAKYHGFTLPTQFNGTTLEQYLQGRSITVEDALSNASLQKIQNTIWRRILTDLPYIRKTKGTISSFRSVLRSMGINPDGGFRLREYGGSKTHRISDTFENKREVAAMLNFSGAFRSPGTIDGEGKDSNRPLFLSKYLSGSRTELGYPFPRGTINKVGSTEPGDGLFTSGSWSVESVFKFESKDPHPSKQSLIRIQTTGSEGGVTNNWLLFNAIAHKKNIKTSKTGSLVLYGSPNSGSSDSPLKIVLNDVDIFDGNKWYVSFGRRRSDRDNHYSSSYFFRAGKKALNSFYVSESISGYVDREDNPLSVITASNNASGAFIAIGSMSLDYDGSSSIKHLNGASEADASYVNFTGKVSGVRFFSKDLTKREAITHIKNFKSVGVEDPTLNYSFTNKETGSFEKLRIDNSLDQLVTKSNDAGVLKAFDFSQNLYHGTITGLNANFQVIDPETFDYQIFTPKFETSRTDNKIRVRSYKSVELAENEGVHVAPLYELPQDETPVDDRRFEVEISSVQALNEDIINIFATLDFFDNAIGDPELMFSSEYRDLRHLRRVYFNRLNDKVSLDRFFEFFKWFDITVGDIFEELVPRTTRFLGTNFVIENHMLERPKFRYGHSDMYLGELDRRNASLMFLQQFIGSIKKF